MAEQAFRLPCWTSFVVALTALPTACGDGIGRPIHALASIGGSSSGGQGGGSGGVLWTTNAGGPGYPWNVDYSGLLCQPAWQWHEDWMAAEDALFFALNEVRQTGYACGAEGTTTYAPQLTMSEQLRCAARLYSSKMHTGEQATIRFNYAGFAANKMDERTATTALGQLDVQALLADLLTRADGADCQVLMDSRFTFIGIGYAEGPTLGYWTIDLASI